MGVFTGVLQSAAIFDILPLFLEGSCKTEDSVLHVSGFVCALVQGHNNSDSWVHILFSQSVTGQDLHSGGRFSLGWKLQYADMGRM